MRMNQWIVSSVFVVVGSIACLSVSARASVLLPPGGGPVALPGTTAAMEADLAGGVLHDKLIPFQIHAPTGALLFAGELQNRVVRSSRDGALHFYYSVRNTKPGLNGVVSAVTTQSFGVSPYAAVDWRPDGLGDVNPMRAQRSGGVGDTIRFLFPVSGHPLVGGEESRFFYIKTHAANFEEVGTTWIQLRTGEHVVLRTAAPRR